MSNSREFADLQSACREGDIGRVLELLDRGVDQTTHPGMPREMTPLMLAAWKGHAAIVQLLVERGANMNFEDGDGFTAITLAAGERFWKIVEFLATHGGDVTHVDARGISALVAAKRAHKKRLVEVLEQVAARQKSNE